MTDASFCKTFFDQTSAIANELDCEKVEQLAQALVGLRARGGRLFVLGVGGSAANASHAVNDFRKLCGIEAYTPSDNVAELTARTNDEGWETVFAEWLKISQASENDAVLVFSVGGGDKERNVSINLIEAIDESKRRSMTVLGIVGRSDGYTAKRADICVVVNSPDAKLVTPHAEAFQAVIWHCLVSHPDLQVRATTW